MHFQKIKNVVVIVLVFIFLFFTPAIPKAEIVVPDNIRVGILYENTSKAFIDVASNSEMVLGFVKGNDFSELYKIEQGKKYTIRIDDYFVKLNGNGLYMKYNPNTENPPGSKVGPLHIQIGDKLPNLDSAMEKQNNYRDIGINTFLAYNDGWYLWTGLYVNNEEAQQTLDGLKSVITDVNLSIVDDSNIGFQVVDESGNVFMILAPQRDEYFQLRTTGNKNPNLININGRNYRGFFELRRYKTSDMTVINILPLEEYLYGVVPSEMSPEWPMEALKAQALAARNYAVANIGKHGLYGFDVCATTHCQVYLGYDKEDPRSNQAINQTKGQFVTYNGKLISTFFHAHSGGYTENSENVYVSPAPYYKGVPDPFSLGYNPSHDSWTVTYTNEDIQKKLKNKNIDVGTIVDLKPLSYGVSRRIISLQVIGTKGDAVLQKEQVRTYFDLKSSLIKFDLNSKFFVLNGNNEIVQVSGYKKMAMTIAGIKELQGYNNTLMVKGANLTKEYPIYPTQIVIQGKGWGHGVGMSQYGARGMAEKGYSYVDIIKYYFQGVKIYDYYRKTEF